MTSGGRYGLPNEYSIKSWRTIARESFLRRDGAKAEEENDACGMIAVKRIERCGFAVERELAAQRGGNVRDEIEFAVVAESVGLDAREEVFLKARGNGIVAEEQFIGAIHILDARPRVIVMSESHGAFGEITIKNFAVRKILVASPDNRGGPVAPVLGAFGIVRIERAIVSDGRSHAQRVF